MVAVLLSTVRPSESTDEEMGRPSMVVMVAPEPPMAMML